MTIGQRIKQARQAKGWSMQRLANKIGVHVNTILYLEQGRNEPTLYVAKGLADALDVTIDWIAGREE